MMYKTEWIYELSLDASDSIRNNWPTLPINERANSKIQTLRTKLVQEAGRFKCSKPANVLGDGFWSRVNRSFVNWLFCFTLPIHYQLLTSNLI